MLPNARSCTRWRTAPRRRLRCSAPAECRRWRTGARRRSAASPCLGRRTPRRLLRGHLRRGRVVKLGLRNLSRPNKLYPVHVRPGTCAEEETHEHGGAYGGEEGYGQKHGGASHEHGGAGHEHGAGAEIEYPLSQVRSDSEGHGSSTTTLRDTTVEKLFSGDPKYVNVHEAGSGNPPVLTCADLKEAG